MAASHLEWAEKVLFRVGGKLSHLSSRVFSRMTVFCWFPFNSTHHAHTHIHANTAIHFSPLICLLLNSLWGDQAAAMARFKFKNLPPTCVCKCACVRLCVCGHSRRAGGRHPFVLIDIDYILSYSARLECTHCTKRSGLICRVLTSVSSLFWAASPHPSWLHLLKAAIQQSHLFQLLVEIGWLETKRGDLFMWVLHLNSSDEDPRFLKWISC